MKKLFLRITHGYVKFKSELLCLKSKSKNVEKIDTNSMKYSN